nr:hypothetical protein GC_00028 [Oryctes rhinoceros nudivirus]
MRGTYNIIWKGKDLCAKKGFYVCARAVFRLDILSTNILAHT